MSSLSNSAARTISTRLDDAPSFDGRRGARLVEPSPGPLLGVVLPALGIVGFLLFWTLASWWKASPIQLPSPLSVAMALRSLGGEGELWAHARVSIGRVVESLVVSTLLAVPIGAAMGLSRRFEVLLDPVVELLRPISGIAWIPLALFIFGVGDALPIFILVYVASFQLVLATVAGVRSVDPKLVNAARTMGVGEGAILRHVVLPAALPDILGGLRLAFAAAWSAIVAAELIGAPSGVGFAIEWYRQLLTTPKVFAFIVVIGVIGILFDLVLRLAQEWLAPVARRSAVRGGARRGKRRGSWEAAGLSLLLPILLLLIWQLWVSTLPAATQAPSPAGVAAAFVALTAEGTLPAALAQSISRVGIGFLVALALAAPLGILMGTSRILRGVVTPVVEGFRPIAPMAILPIAILWLGTGTPTAYAIVAYAAFFPILLNTMTGVAGVDRTWVAAARTMGVSRPAILSRVVLPAALPGILLGARIGMGVAWTAIIAAELAVGSASGGGSSGGIGQMMFVFYSYSVDMNGIVVCMISVGVVAFAIDRLFRRAERGLLPWRAFDAR